jgi:hypothetical protein
MNQELIDELQALLDAEEKEADGYEDLMVSLHHYAPALLQAARENLRLREQLGIMIWLCDEHADFRRAGGTPVEGPIMAKRYIKQAKAALGKETV